MPKKEKVIKEKVKEEKLEAKKAKREAEEKADLDDLKE